MFEILKNFGFLIVQLVTIGIIIIIKFNDMAHMKVDIEKMWTKLNSIDDETRKQGERLARLESRVFNGGK